MKAWFLFFLGTLAYFFDRYLNRKDKNKPVSLVFWLKDNWQELAFAFIIDLAIVIVVLDPHTTIDITKIAWLPDWLGFSVNLILSFFVGYGGGLIVYSAFKKKAKYTLKNSCEEEKK